MKVTNERIFTTFTLSMTALLFSGVSHLHAQGCSERSTVGSYLVLCDGFITPGPGAPLTPAKLLSQATADYAGNFKGNGTLTIGGQILTQIATGTEKVNPDCSGTITFSQVLSGQQGPPLNIKFVISDYGDRIDGLSTDAGAVFSCVLTRSTRALAISVPQSNSPAPQGSKETTVAAGTSRPPRLEKTDTLSTTK